MTTTVSLFREMTDALQGELTQLKNARGEMTLFHGEFLGSFAGWYYYRFEIPEEVLVRRIEFATFTVGQKEPLVMQAKVVALENQFLTAALPYDLGPILPEVQCSWSYEEHFKPILQKLGSSTESSVVTSVLFQPSNEVNRHAINIEPEMLPTTPPDQQTAIKKIFQNRVTYVWGPILSGKTHLLGLLAANFVKAGKKVLFISNDNDGVDSLMLRTIDIGTQLGTDIVPKAARVGLPLLLGSEAIAKASFEKEVETKKEEKKKIFQERVTLLAKYYRTRIKQIFHEDFRNKINELREKIAEKKRQMDQLTQELTQLKSTITSIQNASMMGRLKKGFTKDDLAAAQKQFDEKQGTLKRYQAIHAALSSEVAKQESQSPIPADEQREFQQIVKRIDDLGGIAKVKQAVEEFVGLDERGLLASKQFIATTPTMALSDPRMQGMQFDLVVVDDAETLGLPFLAAVSAFAKEKMIVAGDPFQIGPDSLTNTELAERYLQQDIFLHVAGTEDLHQLFVWTEQHPQWAIFLSSHFATTPKLSLFMASILFDDRIDVFASPQAKGRIYFIDATNLQSRCKQYVGKKKILPFNDQQTKRMVELVKHALMEPGRTAADIGVIIPFHGPTLYTKQQLRLHGLKNIEVGTPNSFRGRRKKAIIFDTVMAGVDYTIRPIDDRKVGEHRIARLFNTILSCVEEDVYVLADMKHFGTIYKDRLFTRLLMLLQSQAEGSVAHHVAVKKYDEMEWDRRALLLDVTQRAQKSMGATGTPEKEDAELALKMKMLAKQGEKPALTGRNYERETYQAVLRVLGHLDDANLLTQYVNSPLLFHHSLSTVEASKRLPIDMCQTENEFRAIMERWNLLVYEMSGGQKAEQTFFSKTSSESRVRWDINSLKAFYSSDVEATVEEGKQRIAVAVSKMFQEMVGKSQPANPAEWSSAYLSFLSRVEAYLSWISEQLRK